MDRHLTFSAVSLLAGWRSVAVVTRKVRCFVLDGSGVTAFTGKI